MLGVILLAGCATQNCKVYGALAFVEKVGAPREKALMQGSIAYLICRHLKKEEHERSSGVFIESAQKNK